MSVLVKSVLWLSKLTLVWARDTYVYITNDISREHSSFVRLNEEMIFCCTLMYTTKVGIHVSSNNNHTTQTFTNVMIGTLNVNYVV